MLRQDRKTKLQIISRLWVHVNDLIYYIRGYRGKSLDQIKEEIDLTEIYCRPYADCDDDELYALDVVHAAQRKEAQCGYTD